MDSVCKLISKILQQRLDKILIEHGLECQNRFMGGRGTTDGISILYQALLKRREHQQASWVVLLDLIKAFPGVPRDLMFNILSKFGVPIKMVNFIRLLHTNVVAKFAIGTGDDETTTCTSGTKQGDPMAATLFLYVIQACLETVDLKGVEFQVPKEAFIGTKNHGPSGVKVDRHRKWYTRELLL